METKIKQGGARKGAGRKKLADKKIQVQIYPRQSSIRLAGGLKLFIQKIKEKLELSEI